MKVPGPEGFIDRPEVPEVIEPPREPERLRDDLLRVSTDLGDVHDDRDLQDSTPEIDTDRVDTGGADSFFGSQRSEPTLNLKNTDDSAPINQPAETSEGPVAGNTTELPSDDDERAPAVDAENPVETAQVEKGPELGEAASGIDEEADKAAPDKAEEGMSAEEQEPEERQEPTTELGKVAVGAATEPETDTKNHDDADSEPEQQKPEAGDKQTDAELDDEPDDKPDDELDKTGDQEADKPHSGELEVRGPDDDRPTDPDATEILVGQVIDPEDIPKEIPEDYKRPNVSLIELVGAQMNDVWQSLSGSLKDIQKRASQALMMTDDKIIDWLTVASDRHKEVELLRINATAGDAAAKSRYYLATTSRPPGHLAHSQRNTHMDRRAAVIVERAIDRNATGMIGLASFYRKLRDAHNAKVVYRYDRNTDRFNAYQDRMARRGIRHSVRHQNLDPVERQTVTQLYEARRAKPSQVMRMQRKVQPSRLDLWIAERNKQAENDRLEQQLRRRRAQNRRRR